MPTPYTGGCQCGAVRYVLTAEPIRIGACHCKECQRQSGSAFGMFMPVKKDTHRRQWQRCHGRVLSGVWSPHLSCSEVRTGRTFSQTRHS